MTLPWLSTARLINLTRIHIKSNIRDYNITRWCLNPRACLGSLNPLCLKYPKLRQFGSFLIHSLRRGSVYGAFLLLLAVVFRSAVCRGDILIGSGAFGWKQRESYDAVCFKKLNVVIIQSVQVDSKKRRLWL